LLDHMVVLFLVLEGNSILFSIMAVSIFPPTVYKHSLSPPLLQHSFSVDFFFFLMIVILQMWYIYSMEYSVQFSSVVQSCPTL